MVRRSKRPRKATWPLSLVMPAFNEADSIEMALNEAHLALSEFLREFEILVIDDGSTDLTARKVEQIAGLRPNVRLIRHPSNRGYGAALRTGFTAARYDFVAFTDADNQFDLRDLEPMLYLAQRYPIVAGYRYARQDPWKRRFYSWGYNVLVRNLLGTRVRDCDCALKVFRRDALGQILPESKGFFVNAEMLTKARQQKLDVVEMGVTHRPRLSGESKVSVFDIPRTLAQLLPFWWSQVLWPRRASSTSRPRSEAPEVIVMQGQVPTHRLHWHGSSSQEGTRADET